MTLTLLERRCLHIAQGNSDGATIVARAQGRQRLHVPAVAARRLVQAGYATITGERLHITAQGVKALKAPLPPVPPVYLHRRDGLTNLLHLAARGEPEVLDSNDLSPNWKQVAEAKRAHAQQDVSLSGLDSHIDRVAALKALAAARGKDIRSDLRQLDHVVQRIERKVLGGDDAAA